MPFSRFPPSQFDSDRLLSIDEIAEILGVNVRTVNRLVSGGRLPPPIRITRKLVRWKLSELQRWLDARQARN